MTARGFGVARIGVFAAHSMGGLVTLRELLTHREVLPRVPVVVFLATPQEGSDITRVARYVANNPALAQMTPADAVRGINLVRSTTESTVVYEKNPDGHWLKHT